jgi:hypothetical protein
VDERVDVGLLHHVFRLGLVLHDGASRAVDALIMAPHQDLEQRGLATAHPGDDFRVAEGGHQRLRRHAPY